ncbi:MAG: hypothetical protein ABI923_12045 [bacterium]
MPDQFEARQVFGIRLPADLPRFVSCIALFGGATFEIRGKPLRRSDLDALLRAGEEMASKN